MFVSFIRRNHLSIFGKISTFSSKNIFSAFSSENRQFPKCIYVQPPGQWLMCKINFQRLKSWDAKFDEDEFKIGAKQVNLTVNKILNIFKVIC